MSTQVTINGETFNIPKQGQSPPWGEDLSDLLIAMVSVINSLSGSADILLTSFTIANNQSAAANVTGLSFDTGQVRSSIIDFSLSRSTNLSEQSEVGQILVTYNSSAASWEIIQTGGGSSGVVFSITAGGQVQYTSTNISGTGYAGKLKFSAKSFLQT